MSDTSTETPALPGDALREGIIEDLRAALGEQLVDTYLMPQRDVWVRVAPEAWVAAAGALKAHGFDYFCFLSAIDWAPSPYGKGEDVPAEAAEEESADGDEADAAQAGSEADDGPTMRRGHTGGESRFQMLARVTDTRRHVSVTLKADVPESMAMPTWVQVFAGANWHERETHEMFGIDFAGHPDLRHLYLPGEFEGNPLRKDFPLLSRMVKPWPGIVDVEPMPGIDDAEETEAAES
ncbi:MAG TPA: NADH-quinone oxidoreductase subunit C [Ilumatobacter sp.]|nr:NADH-quinone oxidoreductase subunit C [Ilumatobacter sp.]